MVCRLEVGGICVISTHDEQDSYLDKKQVKAGGAKIMLG
jgi:hypothetical protein